MKGIVCPLLNALLPCKCQTTSVSLSKWNRHCMKSFCLFRGVLPHENCFLPTVIFSCASATIMTAGFAEITKGVKGTTRCTTACGESSTNPFTLVPKYNTTTQGQNYSSSSELDELHVSEFKQSCPDTMRAFLNWPLAFFRYTLPSPFASDSRYSFPHALRSQKVSALSALLCTIVARSPLEVSPFLS